MTEQAKGTWRSALGRDTLGVGDFDPGDRVRLTIDYVSFDQVPDPKTGKPSKKAVVHFRETARGLVLNATNSQRIAALVGSNRVEKWGNTRIVLGLEEGRLFAGGRGPTVRVLVEESAALAGGGAQ